MATPRDPAIVVRGVLQSYARRGVFRSFSEKRSRGRRVTFRFRWLWNEVFSMTLDGASGAILFEGLLPEIDAGSELETGVRAFVRECCSRERLEHRRVDPRRVAVSVSHRRRRLNLRLRTRDNDFEYGARKAIHLVNEIFLSYLNVHHPGYLAAQFRLPED